MHIMRPWTTRPRENKAKIWTRCKCSQDMNSRREYGSYPCNTAHSARTTAILSCAAKWMQLEQYIRKLPAIETQRAKYCVFSLMCRKEKKNPHSTPPSQTKGGQWLEGTGNRGGESERTMDEYDQYALHVSVEIARWNTSVCTINCANSNKTGVGGTQPYLTQV